MVQRVVEMGWVSELFRDDEKVGSVSYYTFFRAGLKMDIAIMFTPCVGEVVRGE